MKRFVLLFALLASPAFAQPAPQPPQPPTPPHSVQPSPQRIFKSIQQQRNDAMDAAALADARAAQLADEVERLQARINDLEKSAKD